MSDELLSTHEAARRLGISVASLYAWLAMSDRGLLVIRGQRVTFSYLQGGPQGQGRIRIEADEVDRVRELMRVFPTCQVPRHFPNKPAHYPSITVPLGRPNLSSAFTAWNTPHASNPGQGCTGLSAARFHDAMARCQRLPDMVHLDEPPIAAHSGS